MTEHNIVALDRPTESLRTRKVLLDLLDEVRKKVEDGEVNAIVIVPMQATGAFQTMIESGSMGRAAMLGLLYQALHDAANSADT